MLDATFLEETGAVLRMDETLAHTRLWSDSQDAAHPINKVTSIY